MNFVIDELFTLAAAIEENSATSDESSRERVSNEDAVTAKSESAKWQ